MNEQIKKQAKKHLEIALGGNMNTCTLKPKAIIEIMVDLASSLSEPVSDNKVNRPCNNVDCKWHNELFNRCKLMTDKDRPCIVTTKKRTNGTIGRDI